MPLVTAKELLEDAVKGNYAVGAFNCNNMEIIQAIIAAAEAEKSPVIIQASQGAIKYAGLDYIVGLVHTGAEKSKIPICLHLDHGTDFKQVVQCIAQGFSSVMFDGSKLSLEENIAVTKRIVEIARAVGVSVEAELGKIAGTEDDVSVSAREAMLTDPADVKYFVEQTAVDSLAVAIGTAHGQYKAEPKLDFERLAQIQSLVNVPIVMHGSSGVPDKDVQKAISLGVRKVNIDTNIREAFVKGVKDVLAKHPAEIDPRKILGPAKEAMTEIVREKMRVFGSSGKA
ncbi:MAG: class II fructose-1,6-bisphosphate aldolase [Peptococcia bacterium]|jgi:fructose-bisphosphate aldolase class II